jgi:hypothetical protein
MMDREEWAKHEVPGRMLIAVVLAAVILLVAQVFLVHGP